MEKIYREKTLERISSPEQLNEYVHVARPSVWVTLAAVVLLLAGVLVWCIFGELHTTMSLTGIAKSGVVTFYVSDASKIAVGMETRVGDCDGSVVSISDMPLSYYEVTQKYRSDYTVYFLALSEWNYMITAKMPDVPDGLVNLLIVSESVSPISFVLN